jgi:hypothetical protein
VTANTDAELVNLNSATKSLTLCSEFTNEALFIYITWQQNKMQSSCQLPKLYMKLFFHVFKDISPELGHAAASPASQDKKINFPDLYQNLHEKLVLLILEYEIKLFYSL